jgi:membrane protein insertase Oxa1/YidC/SpoIIIJ
MALVAGVSQFVQAYIVAPPAPTPLANGKQSFQNDFARSMNLQMKYVFPIFITIFAYSTSAAVALYWTVGNLFTIGQELYLRKAIPGRKS